MSTTLGLLTRVGGQVKQFLCGLHGHDSLLHFEKGRLSLRCSTCDYQSPGWDMKGAPAAAAVERAESKRHANRMPALGVRRIA